MRACFYIPMQMLSNLLANVIVSKIMAAFQRLVVCCREFLAVVLQMTLLYV